MKVFLCFLCFTSSTSLLVQQQNWRKTSISSSTALRQPQNHPEILSQNEIPNRVWNSCTSYSPSHYAETTTMMVFAFTTALIASMFTLGSAAYATEIFESHDRITDGLPPVGFLAEDGALEVIQSAVRNLINADEQAVQYGVDHYARYFLAGGICASFSHGVAIPFDVVKTRLQTGVSTEFDSSNVFVVAQSIVDKEGLGMLFKGTGPTLIGYLIQGSLKYGFYEVFKPIVKAQMALSGVGADSEIGNKVLGFMIAGACAELIGSSFLAPFEAARIRLVANPSFAPGIVGCLNRMVEEETATSLFLGFPAILSKQVPYTVVQLSTYEVLTSSAYGYLASSGVDIANMGASRYVLSATCALAAAILSSLASQPGDTLLSAANKNAKATASSGAGTGAGAGTGSGAGDIASSVVGQSNPITNMIDTMREVGLKGLYKGTKARLLHVSVIVVVQLLVYDFVKQLCGIPITGTA